MTSANDALWERLRAAAGIGPAPVPASPEAAAVMSPDDAVRPRPPGYEPYILDSELAVAAEIAIRLRQPLLLTGTPGTGKTKFARALAHRLDLPLVVCNIRSTTTVADLYYAIDDLARFRDAHGAAGAALPFQYYLTFNGLGRAILFAGGPEAALRPVKNRLLRRVLDGPGPGPLATAVAAPSTPARFADLFPPDAFPKPAGCRVVVLLDEFDKAPRDTPNDMLNEIDEMAFDIPELGVRAEAPPALRPIVIVTSNSERALPDPFLRRCIYYDVPFPRDHERLRQIVFQHLESFAAAKSPLLDDVLDAFTAVLALDKKLSRRPGTAELLDWLRALTTGPRALQPSDSLRTQAATDKGALLRSTLVTITKSKEDRAAIERAVLASFGVAMEGPGA